MKTTIELPDALMRAAKAMAARRGTTLKALMTRALEREMQDHAGAASLPFEVDEDGLPCLPRRGAKIDSDLVNQLLDDEGE